ncbi:MAG TPA: ABC-2 transporter permease [Pseudobacteroides sp.]|uniref:ABC-2 transporter permease n=1 Tax=Pseudobacteroides sp. TaxID=1968840 RepID=UPI002F923495
MIKALNVAKFDFLTVKPYSKIFFVLLAVGIIVGLGNQDSYMVPPMFMIWASFFVAYPFSIGERNSIENLLGTFSLKRRDIVAGRYIFSLLGVSVATLFALATVYFLSFFFSRSVELKPLLFVTSFGFLIFSLVISFQIPMYFKIGYTKAKVLTFLPLLVIGFLVPLITLIPSESTIGKLLREFIRLVEVQQTLACMLFLFGAFAILLISYHVSVRIYEKKDI